MKVADNITKLVEMCSKQQTFWNPYPQEVRTPLNSVQCWLKTVSWITL